MQEKWPKAFPQLSAAQLDAREKWMRLWHEVLPSKYAMIEKFNHGYPVELAQNALAKKRAGQAKLRTLEVGAGLGGHARWENLQAQDYTMLEYRADWAEQLKRDFPTCHAIHGDIQKRLQYPDGSFDRIIAIHVLEHLPDLPKALSEIHRLLAPGGQFDIVIPCEGGMAYGFARQISSARMFKKEFKMDYMPIIRAEHLSTGGEIVEELGRLPWKRNTSNYFPLRIPLMTANLCLGLQYVKPAKA